MNALSPDRDLLTSRASVCNLKSSPHQQKPTLIDDRKPCLISFLHVGADCPCRVSSPFARSARDQKTAPVSPGPSERAKYESCSARTRTSQACMSRGSRSGTNHVSPVTLLRVQMSMRASLRALRSAAEEIAYVKSSIAQLHSSEYRMWFAIAERPTWPQMVAVTGTLAVVMAFGGTFIRSRLSILEMRMDHQEKKRS